MGARIRAFENRQYDQVELTAAQLEVYLLQLNDLASEVRSLPAGDMQASAAKVDQLRRQYTDWYNAAVQNEEASALPVQSLPELDNEFYHLRQDWIVDDADQPAIQARILDTLHRVEAKPEGDQLAAQIRTFLHDVVELPGY